ncbi:BQ5605_C003g02522 [Microbotryum silenes-dioicae]|uniref:BQ5605_C003g02522 protein n=1 Tax=Microbotryum silenes-dioicae TaxID=796604 RepID=A0A2X0M678_9BASI|nr:BQ5605_C003g02522 [Microbotryum silenes-dioicae]
MFFARSGVIAATLLVLQSTLSIAAPALELEKRITCNANEIAKNNACVSCASIYTNATTCSRSEPLTCSYGVPNSARKCAAVDCSKTPATYLSTNAKQCIACADANALTCNSTTTLSCQANYTLSTVFSDAPTCVYGNFYAFFPNYGLPKPLQAKQQPFKPVPLTSGNPGECVAQHPKARVVALTANPNDNEFLTCFGQNGALDQAIAKSAPSFLLLKGTCKDYAKNPFITATRAQIICEDVAIGPDGSFPL